MNHRIVLALALVVATAGLAAAEPVTSSGGVPALAAMHEVIYPLWHTAWPAKDLALMKELLPQVKEHVAAVAAAKLPAMLHEKQAKWDAGVASLAAAATALDQALTKDQQQGALDAVEELHADYENLVRVLRPALRELDAYHQVLYQLYHHDWPGKKADAIAADAALLTERCTTLTHVALSKKFAARETEIRKAIATLYEDTTALAAAAKAADPTGLDAAVEKVHSQYQAVERLFE